MSNSIKSAPSISSAAASPASLFPTLDSEEAAKMTVISGLKCCELYGPLGHAGLLEKTFLASSQWVSTKCFLTWAVWSTPRGALYYRLQVLERPMSETGFGFWRTPTSRDWKDTPGMAMEATNPDGTVRDRTDQLARQVYQHDRDGNLNPEWVEALMGFPAGWTERGSEDFGELPW